ncbi:DUF805 domain-containing protein [Streptomyces sp. NPDC046805]|uniref:DUF805 domain-containing protein n=1 Tax=Streptomyces sp. NPDC046805 TaxID=3155134 RepID=UPI0033F6A240
MSWFVEALKKYAVFSGRARRKEYWMFSLFSVIIYAVLLAVAYGAKLPLVMIIVLALVLPGWAVTVRRLHDTGRSGWWILLSWVPFLMLVFMCMDSEPGANKYGPNPKEAAAFA